MMVFIMCDIDFCDFWNWGLSHILNNIEKTRLSLSTSFTSVFVSLNSDLMVISSIQLLYAFLK